NPKRSSVRSSMVLAARPDASSAAPIPSSPRTGPERQQSHAPDDRPARPDRGRTNRTAVPGRSSAAPSWQPPPQDVLGIAISLFAINDNRLLQRNRHTAATQHLLVSG